MDLLANFREAAYTSLTLVLLLLIGTAAVKLAGFVAEWYFIERPRRLQDRKRILECLDS